MLQKVGHVVYDGLGTIAVREMSRRRKDTVLEKLRIRSAHHHLCVVIGLDYQMTGTLNIRLHFVGHHASIGDDAEVSALGLDKIAHIARTVVWYGEGRHQEITYLDSGSGIKNTRHLRRQLLRNTIVAVNALVHLADGINWNVIVMAERADRLYMVSMVVSNQHMMYLRQANPVVPASLLQASQAYSDINKQSVIRGRQQIAVTATSTTKREKS